MVYQEIPHYPKMFRFALAIKLVSFTILYVVVPIVMFLGNQNHLFRVLLLFFGVRIFNAIITWIAYRRLRGEIQIPDGPSESL